MSVFLLGGVFIFFDFEEVSSGKDVVPFAGSKKGTISGLKERRRLVKGEGAARLGQARLMEA